MKVEIPADRDREEKGEMNVISRLRFSVLSVLVLATAPQSGAAQRVREFALESAQGGTVRLRGPTLPGGSLTGLLVRWNAESVTVATSRGPVPVPRSAIAKLQVGHGKNRLLWGVLGTIAGFAVATVPTYNDGTVALAILFPFVGAGVGALAAPERWRTLPLNPAVDPRMARTFLPHPPDHPAIIGVRLRF